MARDIGRNGKTGMPLVTKVPAAVAIDDFTLSRSLIELQAVLEWNISFNPRDLEDYRNAIRKLKIAGSLHHHPDTLRRLLAEEVPTKRKLQEVRNDVLWVEYLRSGLSIKRCAVGLAKKNRSLPRNYRYGPTGSTNAETLEKQIRRQKKLMDRNPLRRKSLERLVSDLAQ